MNHYIQKLKTGLREPYKIPPWAVKQTKRPLRYLDYQRRTATLSRQVRLLEDLRAGEDWCLIVLDACRYDALRRHTSLFEDDLRPVKSEGHDTFEYVRRCWPDEYDLPYVSGATPINSVHHDYDNEHFQRLYDGYVPPDHLEIVDVWDTGWDSSLGTCPPWAVTDAALEHADRDRLVAHFFQPHAPYIGEERLLGHTDTEDAHPHQGTPVDEPIWRRVKYGDVSDAELRAAYDSNLRCALAEVCRLIRETEFERYVLMGDHGEALGEWGVYSHPRVPHPKIRTVPWMDVSGLTEAGHEVATEAGRRSSAADPQGTNGMDRVENRLEELGYL